MKENKDENMELLEFVYENAEMGYYTTNDLIEKIKSKENKIKPLLQVELKEYAKHIKKCEKILESKDIDPKKSSGIAKISSKLGIMMETMKDNSDSAIAQMIVQGLTMGSVSLTSKIDKYKECADKRTLKIAKNYLKYLEVEIERLKEYM